ncbi:MAG: twin-arginine translocase subunit TatC [Spirochaetales bacterium]|nr:twin-arginine translocase subunit TatC [Spirochaetales bacterium]
MNLKRKESAKASSAGEMPLLSHMTELRRCLIISIIALVIGFVVALSFYDYIMEFLFSPLLVLAESSGGDILYINTFIEGFLVRLKISALAGFILSSPVHLFNVLYFVFPGLIKKEKRIITVTLISSFIFIVGSFFYSYYTIIPVSIVFLTGKGFIPENTGMLLSFGGNIFYILQFMLMALVVFQMPILLELLLILNVIKRKVLLKFGKYIIVLFFLLSALITPPDFVTQVGLALPMTVLYYLTVLIAKIFKFGEE